MNEYNNDKEIVHRGELQFRVVVYLVSSRCGGNKIETVHAERTFSSYAEAIRFCGNIEIESAELDDGQRV